MVDNETRRRYSQMASEWARRLLGERSFVTLDSETTGLSKEAQFVEIAVVEPDGTPDGRALLNLRVQPSCPLEPEALAVHGLSEERLASAPRYAEVHPLLVGAISGRRVVVYNAAFDRRIFAAHLRRDGLPDAVPHPDADPRYPWECAMFHYARFLAEPDERTYGYYGHDASRPRHRFRRHRLPGGDHTAAGDAHATMRLLFEMAAGNPALSPAPDGASHASQDRIGPTAHECDGYLRIYTPEGGGPFGRKITEPYTEWVRPHARGKTEGGP